jgi:replication-associated recombination protein RarA
MNKDRLSLCSSKPDHLYPRSQLAGSARCADAAANTRQVCRPRAHIGKGRPLHRAIKNDTIPLMIPLGPPGTGKTTAGRYHRRARRRGFTVFSAVSAGSPICAKSPADDAETNVGPT